MSKKNIREPTLKLVAYQMSNLVCYQWLRKICTHQGNHSLSKKEAYGKMSRYSIKGIWKSRKSYCLGLKTKGMKWSSRPLYHLGPVFGIQSSTQPEIWHLESHSNLSLANTLPVRNHKRLWKHKIWKFKKQCIWK